MKTILFLFALVVLTGVLTPIFAQTAEPITVTTDKPSYQEGDTIFITVKLIDHSSGYNGLIGVIAPNGNVVMMMQGINVGSDNQSSTQLHAGGAPMRDAGTYTIKAFYGTESRFAKTTFTFGYSTGTDTDGDGIPNSSDSCPSQKETVNGYQDTDGCPDEDEKKALNAKKVADAKKAEKIKIVKEKAKERAKEKNKANAEKKLK